MLLEQTLFSKKIFLSRILTKLFRLIQYDKKTSCSPIGHFWMNARCLALQSKLGKFPREMKKVHGPRLFRDVLIYNKTSQQIDENIASWIRDGNIANLWSTFCDNIFISFEDFCNLQLELKHPKIISQGKFFLVRSGFFFRLISKGKYAKVQNSFFFHSFGSNQMYFKLFTDISEHFF